MPKTPQKNFLGGLQQKKCPKNMFFSYFKKIPTKKVLLECYLSVIFNIFFTKMPKMPDFANKNTKNGRKLHIFLYTTHEAVRARLLGNNTDRNVWAASVRMIGIACVIQT